MMDFRTVREAVVIFMSAVALGGAYNASSPLGIRFAEPKSRAVSYTNETVRISPPQHPPAPEDASLHNETISAIIVAGGTETVPAAGQRLPVTMAWAEVKALLAKGEVVLVDGRDSLSFETGHIPGAVSLPLKMFNEKFSEFSARFPKTKPLVIYCASIQCPISHSEALLLGQNGYTDVREMPGGYAEWMVAESSAHAATQGQR